MLPQEIRNKKVLISPLNWGMGHVSRCIPLIHLLNKNGNEVIIATDDFQTVILKEYFPTNKFIYHSGYPFRFGLKGNFAWDLFKSFFRLKHRLVKEQSEVEQLVEELNIDLVVSDHRYGFRTEKCHSVFLTHQLNLPVRWYERMAQKIHLKHIFKFNEIWIPDLKNREFSGKLSEQIKDLKIEFIGPLSRFQLYKKNQHPEGTAIIASGPENYAVSFLKEQLLRNDLDKKATTIICSENLISKVDLKDYKVVSSKKWKESDKIILDAERIISRSGYSTLMDIAELKCEFEITPTPGQREQEYLFQLWNKKSFSRS